eukprot:gb/GFBE01071294.1/.p1 GENE.gb/GFBE01071294.1/~~gb/GFBE01071294.1/.p1  ORF type:complete len:460 (+),score=67.72 gb/GFBE01071294.1/:1-1380(+)
MDTVLVPRAPLTARRRRATPRHRSCRQEELEHATKPQRDPVLPVLAGSYPSGGVVALLRYREDGRDWRKLTPSDIRCQLLSCALPPLRRSANQPAGGSSAAAAAAPARERRQGLMAAVATGVLQAIEEGSYWSPGFGCRDAVKCVGVLRPMSRLVPCAESRPKASIKAELPPRLVCSSTPLVDLCVELAGQEGQSRVALAQFSAVGDLPGSRIDLAHLEIQEAQLLLRSTYLKAVLEVDKHIHGDVAAVLEGGSAIYTSDVSILRGNIEDGAPWLSDVQRIDVIWVALPRTARFDEGGQDYASEDDRKSMVDRFCRLIAAAAKEGVKTLVIPEPGSGGSAGSWHPSSRIGAILREAVLTCGKGLEQVVVCPSGQVNARWHDFSSAFEHGIVESNFDPKLEAVKAAMSRLRLDRYRPDIEATATRYYASSAGWLGRLGRFPPRGVDEERPQTCPAAPSRD